MSSKQPCLGQSDEARHLQCSGLSKQETLGEATAHGLLAPAGKPRLGRSSGRLQQRCTGSGRGNTVMAFGGLRAGCAGRCRSELGATPTLPACLGALDC